MARAHRKLHEWTSVLKEAEMAVRLQENDPEAYYERACALAHLARPKEALAALKKSIELDDEWADEAADDEDLKPISGLPEFKKLIKSGQGEANGDGKK